jgi:hypothetical protein
VGSLAVEDRGHFPGLPFPRSGFSGRRISPSGRTAGAQLAAGPFGRKSPEKPVLTLVPGDARTRTQPASATAPAAKAPTIQPSPADAEPLRDTPATLMAMRLLNARVAELDAKVRRLEDERRREPAVEG